MKENVFYNPELEMIEVFSVGLVTYDDLKSDWQAVQSLLSLHDTHLVLVDATQQEALASTSALFRFSKELEYSTYYGVVQGSLTDEDLSFLETTSLNKAKQLRVFKRRKDAIEWLNKFRNK